MSKQDAEALVAKINNSPDLINSFADANHEEAFLAAAKKLGYDVTMEEFKAATAAYQAQAPVSGDGPDQGVGLTFVGIDYAFVGVKTSSG
ncbi:Nif11-like leader peptide family natural product precursor [Heliobacterium undosum]|uniref:Nif11-like leader peptide family natural product n=1 Tax=Heliomicrobium undosum TaxID=121734 RepID=A0A845L217_9FIRM|nr:Nif11-like leader peptide family natural product precursor [Heliomicrobium undosum]MZP30587.1 Nif11-like leader peptide family natural product precursor [Heliomicrobium undosum]